MVRGAVILTDTNTFPVFHDRILGRTDDGDVGIPVKRKSRANTGKVFTIRQSMTAKAMRTFFLSTVAAPF